MPKTMYTVSIENTDLSFSIQKSTYQAAARAAFAYWIKNGLIKKQPRSTFDGGFEGVTIEIRREAKNED